MPYRDCSERTTKTCKGAVWDYGDSLTPNKGSLGVHIRRVRRLSEASIRKRVSVVHSISQNMF